MTTIKLSIVRVIPMCAKVVHSELVSLADPEIAPTSLT